MKKQIKVYDRLWNFKDNIWLKNLIWDIAFSEDINWWQWNLILKFKLWSYYTNFLQWDILQVRWFDKTYPDWTPIYTWIIEDIKIIEDNNWKQISLKILWLITLLSNFIYKDGSNLTFSKNQALDLILKDIIDKFNTEYWTLNTINWPSNINNDKIIRYTNDSIFSDYILNSMTNNLNTYNSSLDTYITNPNNNINLNIWFDKNNLLESIVKIQKLWKYYFYINNAWIFSFKEKRNSANKRLTFNKEILNINQTNTKNNLVNKLYLERSDWTVKIYENIASQNTYWIEEKYENKTDLLDVSSQDIYWNTYISDNKDIKEKIIINVKVDTNINPWDNIKTLNTENQIDNLQVVKINTTSIQKTIYLDEYIWLWNLILNKQ